MSSSGKGNEGNATSYDYFGTIAGLICFGPLDGLFEILIDGKTVWSDDDGLDASGDFTDIAVEDPAFVAYGPGTAGDPLDPMYLETQGRVRIYWGTPTQPADPALGVHPPLAGFAYLVFHRFLFGRERTPAPNITVVGWRLPRVDTAIVAAVDNVLHDGRVNPIAVIAELMTSKAGLEIPVAQFDGPAWQAAANHVATDATRRERMFCSPLVVDRSDVRAIVAPLLDLAEMTMHFTPAGLLTITPMFLGESSAGSPVIDAHVLTQRVEMTSGGWSSVPTGIDARFIDRDRAWKEASVQVDSILAREMREEPDRQSIDMQAITKASQAAAIAGRMLVRAGRPPSSITAQVRSTRAKAMTVGAKVWTDVDPEPGGSGLITPGIIVERREPREGPVTLVIEADTLASSLPYTSERPPTLGPQPVTLPIAHALVIPLAPSWWGVDAGVAILATRPQADVIGMHVSFTDAIAVAPTGGFSAGFNQGFQ